MRENEIVSALDRFKIEAVIAFAHYKDVKKAADAMRLSYSQFYNDLLRIKEATGLNPFNEKDLSVLFNAINDTAKEKMHDKRYGHEKHFGTE